MQDRYVGDVGDFAKYALLRRLAGKPGERSIRIGVVWCLFPNEAHNNDGRHVSYLHNPEFGELDNPLLTTLKEIIATGNRYVSAVSGGGLLPNGTVFCDGIASAPKAHRLSRVKRTDHRIGWFVRCFTLTKKCDFVFFDPDNGLEVASVPKHHPNAGKYIYWEEILPFWRRRQTLLIYHHLNRTKPSAQQVLELRDRFRAELKGAIAIPLVFRRGSCRIFWLVYRKSPFGTEMKRRAYDFLDSRWSKHFRPVGWPDEIQVETRSAL